MWTVTSGSAYCQVTGDTCLTDGVGNHGDGERCTVTANMDVYVTATYYNTENKLDYVTIGGTRYSGSTGPANVQMPAGSSLQWYSDGSVFYGGFTICGSTTAQRRSSPTRRRCATRCSTTTS